MNFREQREFLNFPLQLYKECPYFVPPLYGDEKKIFASYPAAKEAKIVSEAGALLHGLWDKTGRVLCTPLLTMVDTFDFGLSFVLRLTDGRFIVFDGGWETRDYAERLMAVLKKQCVTEKITIAAWIMTHPHIDHYR